MQRFLITTLAEYQTIFWLEVGLRLQFQGHEVAFLSFDDNSTEMLVARSLKVYPAMHLTPPPESQIDSVLQLFGVTHLNYWLSHERFAFGMNNSSAQRRKLVSTLLVADAACRDWLSGGPAVMVQELGGFLSIVGSYFAARKNGMNNWFIEPSFFRGRLFFLCNDFAALKVQDNHESPMLQSVREYLAETIQRGAIVIPLKDRHQYTSAWNKTVNLRNAQRLLEKLVDKYVRGKRQEFNHIASHVHMHIRMLWNSFRLRAHYTLLDKVSRFVYYPLHVPGDMALTLRTPHLLDQLALIDFLCRSVPASHSVAVKEHPAMVGAVSATKLRELLHRYDNLFLLAPGTNNYEVLRKADGVVSINSKSGAEAVLLGKQVLVLGDAFYRSSSLVHSVDCLKDLPGALIEILSKPEQVADQEAIEKFFTSVWQRSLPGELYADEPNNITLFTESLLYAVKSGESYQC